MGLRKTGAQLVGAALTWGLQTIVHSPASNLPGKVAMKVDPQLISHLVPSLKEGSVLIVGTNGKTTTTNLVADTLEAQGKKIICNRSGANLASGVASTLLQSKGEVDWGVFESDELWSAKTLPQTQSAYLLLLNLFRDQLDRCGEIDRIQDAIVSGLKKSPQTTLIYNADDPLCAFIASQISNNKIGFGIRQDLHLEQNTVADAQMCQACSHMFEYEYRQYGQLGSYVCPECGFSRPELDFYADDVELGDGISFRIASAGQNTGGSGSKQAESGQCENAQAGAPADSIQREVEQAGEPADAHSLQIELSQTGTYMIYNVLAAYVLSSRMGVEDDVFCEGLRAFNPHNGRLQEFSIKGRSLLLNLAKNPTGFNQNLKIITQDTGKKFVSFFINDNEADGHDISWIWDCDFEELATQKDLVVFAGGTRKNDLQVRLKHAGIKATLIDGIEDMVSKALSTPQEWKMYAIANYTALPEVKESLEALQDRELVDEVAQGTEVFPSSVLETNGPVGAGVVGAVSVTGAMGHNDAAAQAGLLLNKPLRIVHLLPDLLNLYGDGGNVRILYNRCVWRGIPAEIIPVHYGEQIDLSTADIVFLGGAPDREQKLASSVILSLKDELTAYVEDGGVLLAICGGYQILGNTWYLGEEQVEGLGILDIETLRPKKGYDRLIENIALESSLAARPIIGYENHAGRTVLGEGMTPFGKVCSATGKGNNDTSGEDGAVYKNCIGTYLHGPLLSKNPEIADYLIRQALRKKYGKEITLHLEVLDDSEEHEANRVMARRLKVKY
ncbi:MAG: MurT ligase domain-containing protein [Anaerotardibacter sp.]